MHNTITSRHNNSESESREKETKQMNGFRGIIGRDRKIFEVFQQIRDVAPFDYPVLVLGETGVGKELVAHAIHMESKFSAGPFVPINCGALPEGLVESELFGHVKGSFSGAIRDKQGRFELANRGTLFLDEIAELPKPIQVKLLRFLQEGMLEKVGSEKAISVNVRIIAATNKDLKQEVKKGNFREDLYYRLAVIPIDIPPLRHRKNDIPLLCDHFLHQLAKAHTNAPSLITNNAMTALLNYGWPGNVRELENNIHFAVVMSKSGSIQGKDLRHELRVSSTSLREIGPQSKLDLDAVKKVLIKTGGNKAKAAKLLGVGRATLYRFLHQHSVSQVEP